MDDGSTSAERIPARRTDRATEHRGPAPRSERLALAAGLLDRAERAWGEGRSALDDAPLPSGRGDRPVEGEDLDRPGDAGSRTGGEGTPAMGRSPAAGRPSDPTTREGQRPRAPRRGDAPPPDPLEQDPDADPESVARAIVLRQLSMAPRSRQQLLDKLRTRGCADDVSERVLDRMESVGLVDDESFAELLVRSKQATKGLAKRALAHELRGKGVADETIDDALGSIDPQAERSMAEEVAARTMRRLSGLDPQVQARRLAGVLSRKGYPSSVVYAVVRDAVNDAPEHQRD